MVEGTLQVRSGELVALRLFDVAYAIDLGQAQALWERRPGASGSRSRLATAPAKAVAFGVPPLLLALDAATLKFDGATFKAQVSARLYDFGVVAIALRVGVADVPFNAYARLVNALDRAVDDQASAELWPDLLNRVTQHVAAALDRPNPAMVQEDYLIGVVRAFDRPVDGATLREHGELVELLSGETRTLSAAERNGLLQRSFSYFTDDLVVLTWDRAFIYEPRGDSDVADVIEVANAQLVEFRYYDELLDRELPRMYERIAQAQRATSLFSAGRFAQLARSQYALVAEVTELREKVDNALQVTEDVYLARVYTAALDLFRVPNVSAAVDRKLAIMRDTYSALYDEAFSQRAEILEVAIVLLIVIEIVLALIKH